jgi:hypothetical protein
VDTACTGLSSTSFNTVWRHNLRQEPGAVAPHAGIWEQPARLQSSGCKSRDANCPIQACSDTTVHVGNHMFTAWCKRPGRPEFSAVGATWGSSEHGGLNITE